MSSLLFVPNTMPFSRLKGIAADSLPVARVTVSIHRMYLKVIHFSYFTNSAN